MVDGHALVGHVFANVSVTKVMDCYRACQPNCRCISFNFLKYSNQDNCQLNEENRHLKPGALMAKEDSQYYDLGIIYHAEVKLIVLLKIIQIIMILCMKITFVHV